MCLRFSGLGLIGLRISIRGSKEYMGRVCGVYRDRLGYVGAYKGSGRQHVCYCGSRGCENCLLVRPLLYGTHRWI